MQSSMMTLQRTNVQCSMLKHRGLASPALPATLRVSSVRPSLRTVRATDQESTSQETSKPEEPAQQQPATPAAENPKLKEGQLTAIITGGISLFIAVFYLLIVFALDIRGGELLPPPPEAYIP